VADAKVHSQLHVRPHALPCVFQAALLARQADCELVQCRSLAERESLLCPSATAHLNCETLQRLLLERATFALKQHPHTPLTHGTAMRLQCGGIKGLQTVLGGAQPDVHRLIAQAQQDHGGLTELPWSAIVTCIMAWQPRRRAPHRPR